MATSEPRGLPLKDPISTYPPLSLGEKLSLPFRLFFFGPYLGFNLARCVSLAWWRGLPLHYFACCGFIRTLLGTFAPRQLQYLQGGSVHSYRTWIKWARASVIANPKDSSPGGRLNEDIEPLPDGQSSLMWIGDRQRATKYVLFFHGGGYVQAISWGHMEWCLRGFVQATDKAEVAVACLQYGLAPTVQFPGQLRQAVSALNHLLRSGVQPQDIVLGGDSSGGNLTFLLLAHILHPRPDVEPVEPLTKPLAGVFTNSPWASNCPNKSAWRENDHIDAMATWILMKNGQAYCKGELAARDGRTGNDWIFPLDADPSCSSFNGLSTVLNSLYITAGKHEILRDDILDLAEVVRQKNPDCEVIIKLYPDQAHDFLIVEGMSKKYGEATEDMKTWFSKAILG